MASSTCAILGDGSVGKTSILAAFINDGFRKQYKQTIGVDFHTKNMKIRDDNVTLRLWDVGGQSIHSDSIKSYLSSVSGDSDFVFLVYDVTNVESFNNLEDWIRVIKKNIAKSSKTNIFFVANKIDMYSQRQVSEAKHNKFVKDLDITIKGSIFMSAKTGDNVVVAFYKAVSDLLGSQLSEDELQAHEKRVKVVISNTDEDDGGRTLFADQIEEEDRLAAIAAAERANNNGGCCVLS